MLGYLSADIRVIRDLKIGRRDELRRLPEVNLHNRACARELLPCEFTVVVTSRTPFREFCRRVENVSRELKNHDEVHDDDFC